MSDQEPKGRPTPKRSDAEAERRKRAKAPRDSKEARRQMRARANEERLRQRAALYTGDERMLPMRDQGPIRKRVRRYVDSRLSSGEVFLPVALLVMFAAFIQNTQVILIVNTVWSIMLLLVMVDAVWVGVRVRAIVKREFPESRRIAGHVGYAVVRSLTMRIMRLPKPHYAIGGKPITPKVPKAYRPS